MTWVLARELGRYGITCNSISPRARTRMTENLFGEMGKAEGGFDKFDPRNVAQLVTFLATDEAADISGQNFVVYGGDIWAMGGFHPVGELHRELDVDGRPSSPPPRASCSRASPRASRPSAWPEHPASRRPCSPDRVDLSGRVPGPAEHEVAQAALDAGDGARRRRRGPWLSTTTSSASARARSTCCSMSSSDVPEASTRSRAA